MADLYYGVVGFFDNILLLAPTRDAMMLLLATCESFVLKNNLRFSTDPKPAKSKSKCIFVFGGVHESGLMDHDARMKRAEFIGKSIGS